jgi:hypothetical protein
MQMKAITVVLEWAWNLKALEGYRTKIAQVWFVLAAAVASYQEIATDATLIADHGVDLPDVPSFVLVYVIPPITLWMTAKIRQFSIENKARKEG